MPNESFMLYTAEGENLAHVLLGAVCAEIEDDRLTRLSALDHVSDAMERIGMIDQGINEPYTTTVIARQVSKSFRKAGYLPIDGKALLSHYVKWVRMGAPVEKLPLKAEITAAAVAARDFTKAASLLFGRTDINAVVSNSEPWTKEFTTDPVIPSDVAVFSWRGDTVGAPYLSAIVMGSGKSIYLEDMPRAPNVAAMLKDKLISRDDVNYETLAHQMNELAMSSRHFSRIVSTVRGVERLGVNMSIANNTPEVDITWDGISVDITKTDVKCDGIFINSSETEKDHSVPLDDGCWNESPAEVEPEIGSVHHGM